MDAYGLLKERYAKLELENRKLKSMVGAVGILGLELDENPLKDEDLAKVPGILETQRIHYEE